MQGLNSVTLIGNLGRAPDLRYTKNGKSVANLSVATNESWTRDGEREERTEWHRVTAWGKLADLCESLLTKGSLVYVEGRIQGRTWEDRDGNKRHSTEIIARRVILLNRGKAEVERESAPVEDGDDIPF